MRFGAGMQVNKCCNWILLRGLTRESGHWGNFITKLKAAFPEANICPIDLPGTGVYYKQLSPDNIPAITGQVRAIAQENGWLNESINVLGISLGGMVALDWLMTHPKEIHTGVFVNISLGGLSPFYQRLRWQSLPAIIRVILKTKIYDRELGIIQLISNRKEGYTSLAKLWYRIQCERPVKLKNAYAQIVAAARYRVPAKPPSVPVLLLNSASDRLVAPECSEAIAKLWGVSFARQQWAGHDLTSDDPDWVIAQYQNWLKSFDR